MRPDSRSTASATARGRDTARPAAQARPTASRTRHVPRIGSCACRTPGEHRARATKIARRTRRTWRSIATSERGPTVGLQARRDSARPNAGATPTVIPPRCSDAPAVARAIAHRAQACAKETAAIAHRAVRMPIATTATASRRRIPTSSFAARLRTARVRPPERHCRAPALRSQRARAARPTHACRRPIRYLGRPTNASSSLRWAPTRRLAGPSTTPDVGHPIADSVDGLLIGRLIG